MPDWIESFLQNPYVVSFWPHLLTVGGFLLALFVIARLMSEKRQPSNTVAWLLLIILVPYVGVPLYLFLGGRKLKRLVARKSRLFPDLPGHLAHLSRESALPTAQTVLSSGGTPPVSGNSIRLITDGVDAFKELERQILSAKHTIHITTFILGRDETGRRFVQLLAKRAREGINVRLLLDSVGCMFSSGRFVDPIREAGGEVGKFIPVLPFTPRGAANLRNHRKIAVFDHATAIIGGHNIAREYMGAEPSEKRWRDFGAVVKGPAAALLNEVFLADWCFARKAEIKPLHDEIRADLGQPQGNSEAQVVASGPDAGGDPLYEGIVSMIQQAEKSIWIVTPYFIPDEVLLRSLIVKARAGCDVRLIVPEKSNHPVTDFARRFYVRELRRAGGKILNFKPGMMHSKGIIIDDRMGLLGSANFDLRSLFVNFEIGLLLYTKSDVLAMQAWAEELMSHCQLAPERKNRFLGEVAEDLSRLFAPLL